MVERIVVLVALLQDYLKVQEMAASHCFLTQGHWDTPFYRSGQVGTISLEGQEGGGHTYAAFWSSAP